MQSNVLVEPRPASPAEPHVIAVDGASCWTPAELPDTAQRPSRWQRLGWACARLAFHAYVGFALLTVVGGFLTAPLMSKLFFDDWRCWRYWRRGAALFPHGWRLFALVLRGEASFMLGVPLGSPPQSRPARGAALLSPSWEYGSSCGSCRRCCHVKELRCPVLDTDSGLCSGYNSFYWRYFNCGRYPSAQAEIDYYGCPKWLMPGRGIS